MIEIIKHRDLISLVGSRTTLHGIRKDPDFPKPFTVGARGRLLYWWRADVLDYMARREGPRATDEASRASP